MSAYGYVHVMHPRGSPEALDPSVLDLQTAVSSLPRVLVTEVLREHRVVLIAEPSLQPPTFLFLCIVTLICVWKMVTLSNRCTLPAVVSEASAHWMLTVHSRTSALSKEIHERPSDHSRLRKGRVHSAH